MQAASYEASEQNLKAQHKAHVETLADQSQAALADAQKLYEASLPAQLPLQSSEHAAYIAALQQQQQAELSRQFKQQQTSLIAQHESSDMQTLRGTA